MIKRAFWAALMVLAVLRLGTAQDMAYSLSGPTLPTACRTGNVFWLQGGTTVTPYYCDAGAWAEWSTGSGGGAAVPTGAILFVISGTCPSGYVEETGLDGKTLLGTLAAHANIGTTGGADTITPAGTNGTGTVTPLGTIAYPAGVPTHSGTAATFTGNALGTHAHELPWQIPSTTTIRQIAVATFGTGTSRAATAVSAAGTANTTSAAVALSQAVTAGTPAGTVAWPAGVPVLSGTSSTTSAQVFTGTQFDNRSNFVRLIGCRKT